jgi:hypothetical protein
MTVQVVGAQPGETFCFNVLLQHPDKPVAGCCCAFEKCITVPECPKQPFCIGDSNLNGTVDVDDLIAVITSWGPCPAPCPADVSPPPLGDGMVNVDDLILVILSWGKCP